MGSHSLHVTSERPESDWRHIEELLDELAAAAKASLPAGEFYRLLLARLIPATGASAGAVWTAPRSGELRLERQVELVDLRDKASRQQLAVHQRFVESSLAASEPRLVTAAELEGPTPADSVGQGWAVFFPFRIAEQAGGVIELVERRSGGKVDRAELLRLLAAVVELADDFHRNIELSLLRQREQNRDEADRFALAVHGSLDPQETALVLANEGRRVVGCDRLHVLVRHGRNCRASATSGVATLERRAKGIRLLERLVNAALTTGEPLWYSDSAADIPEQIAAPLEAYVDESHARTVAILPLYDTRQEEDAPPRLIGAMVAEQFQASGDEAQLRARLTETARHGQQALANSLMHWRMPLARAGRLLGRVTWLAEARQLPKTALALGILGAIVAALVFIPANFEIEAKGELQPQVRRDVFATSDGIVDELLVREGGKVRAGESLVVLRKPELDLELRRVAGEAQTLEKRLAAVQAERLSNARDKLDTRRQPHQLTADEEEIKQQLAGLAHEREILEAQRRDLVVRSPIDGQALTWKLEELLKARPVERGQALLTVADVNGPWVVELRVDDKRTGHVLAARNDLKKDLDVQFALASDPSDEYQGHITDVAMATQVDEVAGPTVLTTVAFDRNQVHGLRPGATVLARIHCGTRSLGYVWLHDLFEFAQTHWWW